jgi:hypothetical protein
MPSARRARRRVRLGVAEMQPQLPKAIKGENVEGVKLNLVVLPSVIQAIAVGGAVNAKQHGFTVDNKLARIDPPRGLDDQRVTCAQS